LINLTTDAIQKVKAELGQMLEEATIIIQFLNSKNKYELQELEIEDRTETILEVKRVLSKRNLMQNVGDKFQNMQVVVDKFMAKFQILIEMGLPNPLVINDKLMTQEDYNKKIREVARG